jgi:uncharacterized membrane protein
MIFFSSKTVSLSAWLWYTILAMALRVNYAPFIQSVNKHSSVWRDRRGGIAGFLLYAIIVIVLIIVLILVLRFLFNVI